MAFLLKALTYLGCLPEKLDGMPGEVCSFIAITGSTLGLPDQYPWVGRTRDQHLFLIRQHTDLRGRRLLQACAPTIPRFVCVKKRIDTNARGAYAVPRKISNGSHYGYPERVISRRL